MVREDLRAMTPRLRRYARALVSGSADACEVADSLVHATLMRAMGSRHVGGSADVAVRLFATVTQLHRDLAPAPRAETVAGARSQGTAVRDSSIRDSTLRDSTMRDLAPMRGQTLAASLLRLPVEDREALLLVVLERFDHATAARILRISRPVLFERLTRARQGLGRPNEGAVPVTASPAPVKAPYLRLVVG